jgi:DNA-binding MarR family transcriptional regulator
LVGKCVPISRDYSLWRIIDYTHRSLEFAITKELRKQKLSPEIVKFLWTLYREHYLMGHDPMPVDIARITQRTPQTITAIMKRALEKGYIYKIQDEAKSHSYRLALTEKGVTTCEKTIQNPIYGRIFAALSQEDRRQLEVILPKLETRNRRKLEKIMYPQPQK